MLGEEPADSGRVQRGQLVELGYYDQHLKTLAADKPVIRAVWPEGDPDAVEQPMRDLLGRFGLNGDQVYQKVGELSGGEKSRAALARLVALGVNVLVLDEPTNHLDLWACDALEQALQGVRGNGDRGQPRPLFPQPGGRSAAGAGRQGQRAGDPRQLRHLRDDAERSRRPPRRSAKADRKKEAARSVQARAAAPEKAKKKRKFPYRKVEDIETDIAAAETELAAVEQALGSPELYRDGEKVKQTTARFEELKARSPGCTSTGKKRRR